MRHHVLMAIRMLARHPSLAIINLVGLGIGLAATVLILLYVQDERSYDNFHPAVDRLVRVSEETLDENGGTVVHRSLIDPPIATLAASELADVEMAARLTPVGPLLSAGDRHVSCGDCYWADPEVLDLFGFSVLAGDSRTALGEPFTLVLTRSLAETLFPGGEALGQSVEVNHDQAFLVTAVIEDPPHNTHLPVQAIGSISTLERWFGGLDRWESPNYATYLRLRPGAGLESAANGLNNLLARHRGSLSKRSRLHVQPVADIHLRSELVGDLSPGGNLKFVRLFTAVGILVLMVACMNFVNLMTARSAVRAREVGVRQASGARRADLVRQFLTESTVTTVVSGAFALGLVAVALPTFNAFAGKSLSLGGESVFLLGGVMLVVGLLAGAYPAGVLSGFRPIQALRGTAVAGGGRFRSILVGVQFFIAILLGVATATVYGQLRYMNARPLGFQASDVVVLPTIWDLREEFDAVRERLEGHPDVLAVSQSNPIPSRRLFGPVDVSRARGSNLTTVSLIPVWADEGFFRTYGIPVMAGRSYVDERAGDATGFVLNETAVARLGLDSPDEAVGLPVQVGGWRGEILGVVQDFHFESLHQEIAPLVFFMDPRNYRLVSVRYRSGADVSALSAFLEATWQSFEPDAVVNASFLEDRIRASYAIERKTAALVGIFSVLAALVTVLGLYGLVSYTIERRRRELSVRRVLGARPVGLALLLSRGVLTLVFFSALVAFPVAWLGSSRWLDGFAYHMSFPVWLPAAGAMVVALLAMTTVGLQTARVSGGNPADSLRGE